jgi:dienelactone hydrolase
MRALAINFSSTSLDDDMVAGLRELRRRGAKRIILVGASMGGTAALVAVRRPTLLVSLRCQHHGSSVVWMRSRQSAALRVERSFSPDGKTCASLATPVSYTER